MPLVAAAVCPHPPLIVPEVAGGAAPELDDLRRACDAAVHRLLASRARRLVVIGGDDADRTYQAPFTGTFTPWGVPVRVSVEPATTRSGPLDQAGSGVRSARELPLSLLVGAWLLARRPAADLPPVRMHTLGIGSGVDECAGFGARYPDDGDWALLAMGDGSACRGEKAPGYADPRAEAYDEKIVTALAGADPAALLDLDPAASAELKVAGRAPWQALAGAVSATGGRWRGEVTYAAAPYGVTYFVSTWEPTS